MAHRLLPKEEYGIFNEENGFSRGFSWLNKDDVKELSKIYFIVAPKITNKDNS